MAHYAYTYLDNSGEKSTVIIPVEEPSEVELDWETIVNANEANVRAAINAVTLATLSTHHVVLSEEEISDVLPASQWAQRELKLRVFYVGDTSGNKRTLSIPAPDLGTLTLQAGSDLVDMTAEPAATLKTQLEANVLLPYGAGDEPITVTKMMIVGRNS